MLHWLTPTTQRVHRHAINLVAVPAARKRIKAALSTLNLPLQCESGMTVYCGEASAIIVMSIEMDAGIDMDNRTERDKINAIFFMLIVSSRLSEILNVSFEKSATLGSVEFVDGEAELKEVFSHAMSLFQSFTHGFQIVKSVDTVVSHWIEGPTNDRYEILVEMFKTTAKLIKVQHRALPADVKTRSKRFRINMKRSSL